MAEEFEPDDYICERTGKYCFLNELFAPSDTVSSDILKVLDGEHNMGEGALEDVCDGYDEGCDEGCIRKNLAKKMYSRRKIEQLRCIADYRYILSEQNGGPISPGEAARRWILDGFAAIFAEVYSEKKSKHEIIRHWDLYVDSEKRVNGR